MNKSTTITAVASYLTAITIPLRLACTASNACPLVISLWYLYEDGLLYCATQQNAKVVQYLQQDPRCGFEIAADEPPYCGVRGQAIATIEAKRGPEILTRLLERYLGDINLPLAQKLRHQQATEVAIVLEPQQLYRWDFSQRMAESVATPRQNPCP